jgi:hypothetical protein
MAAVLVLDFMRLVCWRLMGELILFNGRFMKNWSSSSASSSGLSSSTLTFDERRDF